MRSEAVITSEQVKQARQLLGWDCVELAYRAGTTDVTICRFESGANSLPDHLAIATRRALEFAGVEFSENEPPRLKLVYPLR